MTRIHERPPIGGASLECMLGYCGFARGDFDGVRSAVASAGFKERDGYPRAWLDHTDRERGLMSSFDGILVDIRTRILVLLDVEFSVVSLSVPEDTLWIDGDEVRGDRMRAFFDVCAQVASWRTPATMAVGSEPAVPSEISPRTETAVQNWAYTPASLSAAAADELARWYDDVYRHRWSSSGISSLPPSPRRGR